MTWPLEPEGARRFAEGLQEVIVVEEKRSQLEDQLVACSTTRRPTAGRWSSARPTRTAASLLPSEGELSPTGVAMVIADRLMKHAGDSPELHAARWPASKPRRSCSNAPPAKVARTPFFCSGCPHNTSTRVPEGSRAHGRHRLPLHGDLDARPAHRR